MRLGNIYPPELLIETLNVASRCDFDLDTLRYELLAVVHETMQPSMAGLWLREGRS